MSGQLSGHRLVACAMESSHPCVWSDLWQAVRKGGKFLGALERFVETGMPEYVLRFDGLFFAFAAMGFEDFEVFFTRTQSLSDSDS
jgi:hypothetical protein